jgi:hypothetical protein
LRVPGKNFQPDSPSERKAKHNPRFIPKVRDELADVLDDMGHMQVAEVRQALRTTASADVEEHDLCVLL